MSAARIGDMVEDGPAGGRWIYTDRREGVPYVRRLFGGGDARPATHPDDLRVIETRAQLIAECPKFA
ncbi:hypothetical protein ACIPUC_08975 [Streptomyces sp. LARHCF249]